MRELGGLSSVICRTEEERSSSSSSSFSSSSSPRPSASRPPPDRPLGLSIKLRISLIREGPRSKVKSVKSVKESESVGVALPPLSAKELFRMFPSGNSLSSLERRGRVTKPDCRPEREIERAEEVRYLSDLLYKQ